MTALFPLTDQLGAFIGLASIERPVRLDRRAAKLTRREIWSDCAICGCDVNACGCDPDDYTSALLTKLNGRM